MSKRAEERGLEAYPNERFIDASYADMCRSFYQEGYEQAEEDLALTIADIERIHVFLYAVKNNKQGAFTFQKLKDEQYQEVLDKFNKAKEQPEDCPTPNH
jgi:hypothetical protein